MKIGIDENCDSEWFGQVAKWGYDLVCARPGEDDWSFVDRCTHEQVVAILSKDSDIFTVCDRMGYTCIIAKTPKELKRLLYCPKDAKLEKLARTYRNE